MQFGKFHFGYNAVEDKARRQAPKTRTYHEAEVLTKPKRRKATATAQDQIRNHSLVAWMVRKHLDYVSKFHVSFRTDKPEVDQLVNRIFKWHGAPRNLDSLGRFGRDEMFRLFELEKVVTGDAGLLKLDGLKLQAIESDLIAQGSGAPENVNKSGLVVDKKGRVLQYAICERGENGADPIHSQLVTPEQIIFDGYWTRFSSQYRGISPLMTAINMVQDIHEAFEYNLIKAKMHALFGIAILREPETEAGLGGNAGTSKVVAWTASAYTWEEGDYCSYLGKIYACQTGHSTTSVSVFATDYAAGKWAEDTTNTATNIDPTAINVMDMNPGDDVKVIESCTPSTEFIEGSYLFIQIAMLALDIPITCFDSRRSSFSARIADLNEYEVSSDAKRTKNRYVRQDYSDWLLRQIWDDAASPWKLRQVAGNAGMSLRDVQESLDWVSSGTPWLSKLDQLKGDDLGISIGLDNPIDAARRRGADVFENIDKIKRVQDYAKAQGVDLKFGSSTDRTISELVEEQVNRNEDDNEE
jgi:capsid protein